MSRHNTRCKLRERIIGVLKVAQGPLTIKEICDILKAKAKARGYKAPDDYKVFGIVAELTAKATLMREQPFLDLESAQHYNNREIHTVNWYMVRYSISPLLRLAMVVDEAGADTPSDEKDD